jgi:hypothetical protein
MSPPMKPVAPKTRMETGADMVKSGGEYARGDLGDIRAELR